LAQGRTVLEVVRKLGVTEQTYYRWQREYGGLRTDQAKRLNDLFVLKGVPDHIRSDNGSEFTAKRVREWLERVGVKTLSIEPGSPWGNGYVESFNGKLRNELLAREVFDTLLEAKVLIERWRRAYNTIRPHSSLGYRPRAPESRRPRVLDRHPCDCSTGKGTLLAGYWHHAEATPMRASVSTTTSSSRRSRTRITGRADRIRLARSRMTQHDLHDRR
jgi:putative transposase